MNATKQTKTHLWTEAGLGSFPFRVRGVAEIPSKSLGEANPHAYQIALSMLPKDFSCGTCDVCGRSIKINFLIESADGRKFVTGSSCVNKSGDRGMIEKVKYLKNKRNREKAAAKREEERLARLQAQRDRNGGLTDYELEEKRIAEQEARRQEAIKPALEIMNDLADMIEDGRGGFCDSIARDLRRGTMPYGRGRDLMIEIIAKANARKGSQTYQTRYEEIEALVGQALTILG